MGVLHRKGVGCIQEISSHERENLFRARNIRQS